MINQEYFYALLKLLEPCREMHRGSLTGLSCTSGCAMCLSLSGKAKEATPKQRASW